MIVACTIVTLKIEKPYIPSYKLLCTYIPHDPNINLAHSLKRKPLRKVNPSNSNMAAGINFLIFKISIKRNNADKTIAWTVHKTKITTISFRLPVKICNANKSITQTSHIKNGLKYLRNQAKSCFYLMYWQQNST